MKKEAIIGAILLLVCIITWSYNHRFLSVINLQQEATLIGMFGIFSIGMGLIIITKGIDLSVGSLFALQGVLLSKWLTVDGWHWYWACLASIGLTTAIGYIHSVFIAHGKMQPFIITLCGFMIYRSFARWEVNDQSMGLDRDQFPFLGTLVGGNVFGIPCPFIIMVVIAVIVGILLHRSVFGRHLFAVGRNEEAARYSGINSARVVTIAYIINGILVGIAGIIVGFYGDSVSPAGHALAYELYAIAAAVLGGCSLWGGEGSVLGIVLGTALLQVLQNLVNLMRIDTSLNGAVVGIVIFIGALVDQIMTRRRRAKKIVILESAPGGLAVPPAGGIR